MNARDVRQGAIWDWTCGTFGEDACTSKERAMRFLEEAIELVQAEGIDIAAINAVLAHVLAKEPGNPVQEAGGVGLTLLAYCESKGFSADDAEAGELVRVKAIDPEKFRARHNKKADAGIAVRVKP